MTNDHGIARVALNRPAARNAIPADGWAALAGCITDAAMRDPCVLVVESAVAGSFCAGADLDDLARLADDPAGGTELRLGMAAACDAIATLPCPSIALVDGGCFGAGVALAIACDLRVAGPAARFAIPPARLGIVYPAADVARLVALVGRAQVIRLLATGATIDGSEAARIGLVEIHATDAAAATAELAEAITANAPHSVTALRAMASGALTGAAADRSFDEAFAAPAFATRIAAMRGSRRTR
ncbi:enoyl-CoA hydratase/isomerase family protein [Sphingomonas sp. 1P06PA]|uniref:enoyl-CoA hydratase/isomerase family protein n=1 Tax=Sphingomonas sp. 1P06PA TaxID=554121 RepID=UPI0039A4F3C6